MAEEPLDTHVLGPGLLPTPFDPAELRAGCPDGRQIRMRIEADGRIVAWRTNRFRGGDAEGTTLESEAFDADGRPTGEPTTARVTWRALQGHASFEAARTTRTEETIETPLGTLDCWRYSTLEEDGSTGDYWFAHGIAGMPIRYRSVVDGRVKSEVIVVENRLPEA